MASIPPSGSQSHQSALESKSNNCLFLLRQLRNRAMRMQMHICSALKDGDSPDDLRLIEPISKKVNESYDILEATVKQLPSSMPVHMDKMERMKSVYQEEQGEPAMADLLDNLVDALNCNESVFQMHLYLSEMMKHVRKKPSTIIPPPLAYSTFDYRTHPHQNFESLFGQTLKECQQRKLGITMKFLERTSVSSIFELRFGFLEKSFVCTQKMLMVENSGIIDQVMFIAPHEEWTYINDYGDKRVDLTAESRYLVYRKLTIQGNLHLIQSLGPNVEIRSQYSFTQVILYFSRVHQCFEGQCRSCGKYMKDFLPILTFDLRNPKVGYHENCR